MLTKIRNIENQEFLSCHAAAVVAEVEAAAAAAAAPSSPKKILGNLEIEIPAIWPISWF